MTSTYQDEGTIRSILHTARTIAVVGLSSNVLRPSNFVGFYLQRHGYRIVPVNPRETEILGETCYPSLVEIPFPVDVVDVFRAPRRFRRSHARRSRSEPGRSGCSSASSAPREPKSHEAAVWTS